MKELHRRIQSPAALLAFEAAARHLSFTAAAGELNVSQPAVSLSVKKLEQALSDVEQQLVEAGEPPRQNAVVWPGAALLPGA